MKYSCFLILFFLVLFQFGCSSGKSSPVSLYSIDSISDNQFTEKIGITGIYDLVIDFDEKYAELSKKRHTSIGESYLLNGRSYFTTFPCSSCFSISGIGFDFDKIVVDFKIQHPMEPGDPGGEPSGINRLDLDIFDLALLVRPIGHTPVTFELTDQSVYPDVLDDPDGYSTELANLIGDPTGLPYILVVDDSEKSPPQNTYNAFPMGTSQEFKVGFLNELGETLHFELYLTFAYGASATWETRLNPVYYNPEFNHKSAWKVEASPHNAWFSFDNTTPVNVEVKVYDWQIGANVDSNLANINDIYEVSDIESISIEIPGMHNMLPIVPGNQFSSGTGRPDDPLIYNIPIANENSLPGGEYLALVKVTDQRQPKNPAEGRDFVIDSPDGVTLNPNNLNEYATYQTFNAIVTDEITFNPVDVTPPYLSVCADGIWVEGNYAYVAAVKTGLHVFDISDPMNISWVTMVDTPGTVRRIHISNGYALVSDGIGGAHIIDIDPLDSISIVKSFDQYERVNDVFISGSYGFFTDTDYGLMIISVSDPASAEVVETIPTTEGAKGVFVAGKYAYVCVNTAGVDIIDVENPGSSSIVNTVDTPYRASQVIVEGDYAFIADGSTGELQIMDISDPLTASIVKEIDIDGRCEKLFYADGYIYISSDFKGLHIVDVDPVNTASVVDTVEGPGWMRNAWVEGQTAFIANWFMGLQVASINPPSSEIINTFRTVSYVNAMDIKDDYMFTASSSGGVQILDISEPENTFLYKSVESYGYPNDLCIDDGYAYVADGYLKFSVLDIDPVDATHLVGTLDRTDFVTQVVYNNGYAYAVEQNTLLQAIDVDPPDSPSLVGTLDITNTISDLFFDGQYIYASASSLLHIIDISTPNSPSIMHSYDASVAIISNYTDGEYAYITCSMDQLKIIDIDPPASASEVNSLLMQSGNRDIYVENGYAYVVCGENGLVIIDVDPPETAVIITIFESPSVNYMDSIIVENGYAYAGMSNGAGLRIIDLW